MHAFHDRFMFFFDVSLAPVRNGI